MSCPDWPRLVLERDARRQDPPGWREALVHLETCEECRARGVAADPLLAFRLATPPMPADAAAEETADAMRRSVGAVLRSRELERSRRRPRRWGWMAATAALLVAVVGLAPSGLRDAPESPTVAESESRRAAAVKTLTEALPVSLVEGVDRPRARIYEMRQDQLAVVMIVDETLDV